MKNLSERYCDVRSLTEELAAPLSAEDQTVQSMPDVSPTKWHRGHTSWFFETFLLEPNVASYSVFDPAYPYLFNSYYEAVGSRYPRAERGLVSRPGIDDVARYRRFVDEAMLEFVSGELGDSAADVAWLVELGLHHEQQHQELLLMDIKHVLSRSPLFPAYRKTSSVSPDAARSCSWVGHEGGLVEIGHEGDGFCFDNEMPRHAQHLMPFELADRLVTNGEWLEFIDDAGYRRPELWLSEGWATVQAQGWEAPLYWQRDGSDGGWSEFGLDGLSPVAVAQPVCHVSYFEADAYSRWAGARLPTEAEWESVAVGAGASDGRYLDLDVLRPLPAGGTAGAGASQMFGDAWEWTSSPYTPYPGFREAPGAVGEYNGKFMVNQQVLRGGSCFTPAGHARPTYRNFFPASARWACSGVRLARHV